MAKIIRYHKSIRLKNYDYSQAGSYFITICTHKRACIFGDVVEQDAGKKFCHLNSFGEIIQQEWIKTAELRKNIILDEFIVMPNHFHGIVIINYPIGVHSESQKLASLIGGFKATTTSRINKLRCINQPVWQRNYYEHIINNDIAFDKIQEYIFNNAYSWKQDRFYNKL